MEPQTGEVQAHVDRMLEPGRGMGGGEGEGREAGPSDREAEGLTVETAGWSHTQFHGINKYIKNHES